MISEAGLCTFAMLPLVKAVSTTTKSYRSSFFFFFTTICLSKVTRQWDQIRTVSPDQDTVSHQFMGRGRIRPNESIQCQTHPQDEGHVSPKVIQDRMSAHGLRCCTTRISHTLSHNEQRNLMISKWAVMLFPFYIFKQNLNFFFKKKKKLIHKF